MIGNPILEDREIALGDILVLKHRKGSKKSDWQLFTEKYGGETVKVISWDDRGCLEVEWSNPEAKKAHKEYVNKKAVLSEPTSGRIHYMSFVRAKPIDLIKRRLSK